MIGEFAGFSAIRTAVLNRGGRMLAPIWRRSGKGAAGTASMAARMTAFPLSLRVRDGGLGVVLHARPIAVVLTFATVLALFLLSGTTLMALGVPYGGESGNALLKIHPATYLSLLAALAWLLADGGPGRFLGRIWKESPGLVAFLAAIVLLLFQVVAVQKTPISQVADNFVLTAALFLSLDRLCRREADALALLVHAIIFANSLIGYAEIAGGFHLVPVYVNGELADYDWRAVALFGHPLINAAMTALYIIILALGHGPFTPLTRRLLVAFHLGAMVCFGGRTATVLVLAALAAIGGAAVVGFLAGRRFSLSGAAVTVALATLVLLAGILAFDHGLFDLFLSRFEDDSGSAETRVLMLSVFRDLALPDILLAPDQRIVHATQLKLNLDIAIESSLVGFVAYFGGIVTFFFFIGLGCYFSEFYRRFGPQMLLATGTYVFISISATSFSTKSTELGMLTAIFMLCFRSPERRPSEEADAHRC